MTRRVFSLVPLLVLLALAWSAPAAHAVDPPPLVNAFGACGTNPSAGDLANPWGVAVAPDGTIFVADRGHHRVAHFTATGTYLGSVGSYGVGPGQFDDPIGVACDAAGNLYVVDRALERITRFTSAGAYSAYWAPALGTPAHMSQPVSIAVRPDGRVFVGCLDNRCLIFEGDGTFVNAWWLPEHYTSGTALPYGIAWDDGYVYVADELEYCALQRYSDDFGNERGYLGETGGGCSIHFGMSHPRAVVADHRGHLYVASSWGLFGVYATDGTSLVEMTLPRTALACLPNGDVVTVRSDICQVSVYGGSITPAPAASWGRLKTLYR